MALWQNWSQSVSCTPQSQLSIKDEDALCAALTGAPGPLRVAGAGHSFTPLVATDGTQLMLDGFCDVAPCGPESVRAGTGIHLHDLTQKLHNLGAALANMGDIDAQRLGGALATGTHGTGPGFGTYSAMLHGITLFDGQGQRHRITRDSDATLFRALAVSLGTGGVQTEAEFTTVAPYRLAKRRYAIRLDDALDQLDHLMRSARNVEFYYIPHSGAAMVMESRETSDDVTARPPDNDQKALRQLRMAATLAPFPRLRRGLLGWLMMAHSEERFTEDWNRAFPTNREGMRFNESEWHLPPESAPAAIAEVVAAVEQTFPRLFFPMEVRMTAGDDLFLSPFQGGERVSLAVHEMASRDFAPVLGLIEPIFLRHGGRPHWGKLHTLKVDRLRPLYPDWDEAIEVRRSLDPDGRLVTPYLAQLLGL